MTHRKNLDSILKDGAIYSTTRMSSRSFISIANELVQNRRSEVTIAASGRRLHDYVPLYFGNRTPMIASLQDQNEEIMFFRFSLEILLLPGVVVAHVYDIICFSEAAKGAILFEMARHGRTWTVTVNPGNWYFRKLLKANLWSSSSKEIFWSHRRRSS